MPLWLLVLVTFSGALAMHMFVPALAVAAQSLRVDAAAGLYGFTQRTIGALCTTLAGPGRDPAVAAAPALVGAALLARASFRAALRTPARTAAPL